MVVWEGPEGARSFLRTFPRAPGTWAQGYAAKRHHNPMVVSCGKPSRWDGGAGEQCCTPQRHRGGGGWHGVRAVRGERCCPGSSLPLMDHGITFPVPGHAK